MIKLAKFSMLKACPTKAYLTGAAIAYGGARIPDWANGQRNGEVKESKARIPAIEKSAAGIIDDDQTIKETERGPPDFRQQPHGR